MLQKNIDNRQEMLPASYGVTEFQLPLNFILVISRMLRPYFRSSSMLRKDPDIKAYGFYVKWANIRNAMNDNS